MASGIAVAETETEITLAPVVVTATRMEQGVETVPANVTVINEEDIKNSNAKSVVDLLRSEEGVVVRDLLGNGKTSQVDLRGFGEGGPYNTLVLVDGRRVNEIDLSGVDWTQIPLGQIERVEIVRGTGSVLYGDNAAGGVINIITKTPSQALITSAGITAGSYGRHKEEAHFSGGRGHAAASVFASYEDTDGYRDNNDFMAKDIGGQVVFDPTELLSLNLSGSYHAEKYGLLTPLTEGELTIDRTAGKPPFDEAKGTDQYLKFGIDLDLDKSGRIVTDVSYRDRETEAEFVDEFFDSLYTTQLDREANTWGITPRYIWKSAFLDHPNTFIAGLDVYLSELDLETSFGVDAPPALSSVASAERDSYGFYFNNEFSLFDNLILSLGIRHQEVQYDLSQKDLTGFMAPLDDAVTDRENAYSAGLVFLYDGTSSVFVRTNLSTRFPLADEMVETVEVAPFTYQLQLNSDLKPQVGRHYEAGVKHYFSPDILGRLTLFRAEIKDEIFLDKINFAPFGSNVNHPETLHQGLEIGSTAELFDKLTLFGNYAYTKATFEKNPFKGNDIPAIPEHKASVGFRIHDIVSGLAFSADYNYVGSSYAISDQENQFDKLEDYYTIDARLSYTWRFLEAFVGVNNLTDEEYSEYAVIGAAGLNFHPAPERNWVGGLKITF